MSKRRDERDAMAASLQRSIERGDYEVISGIFSDGWPLRVAGRTVGSRRKELVEETAYELENAGSDAEVERGIKISKTIESDLRFDVESASGRSTSAGLGVSAGKIGPSASLSRQLEQIRRTLMSGSMRRALTVEDSVTVKVPPRKNATLIVRWMRVLEAGELTLMNDKVEYAVPYEECVDLIFDVRTSS